MGTVTMPDTGSEGRDEAQDAGGTCGVLGQIDDDRIQMMGLLIRTHRLLTDSLGRPSWRRRSGSRFVFFDVLIHVGAAPEGRLTMSRLSTDVALTTGGVTRLVDRMVDAGLVARENCPNDRRSIHVVRDARRSRGAGAGRGGAHRRDRAAPMEPLSGADRAALRSALSKLLRWLLIDVVGFSPFLSDASRLASPTVHRR